MRSWRRLRESEVAQDVIMTALRGLPPRRNLGDEPSGDTLPDPPEAEQPKQHSYRAPVGISRPAARLSNVVFPAPLGSTSPVIRPGGCRASSH